MATEGEPDPKRIRSSEPDLKVVIGSEDNVVGAGDGEGKMGEDDGAKKQPASVVTKWYHSQALATKSKYIDALLAAPMKESESRTITFPDITPAAWELMIKLIDDPIACRTAKAEEVVKVARFYDKYEFTGGTKLCDHVLEEYFKGVAEDIDPGNYRPIPVIPNVDSIVDAVVVAKDANLMKSYAFGLLVTLRLLGSKSVPVGRTLFSVDHMRKLAPIMSGNADEARILGGSYDVKSNAFPEQFVGDCSDYFAHQTLASFISYIQLSGSNCADGHFKKGNNYSFWLNEDRRFGERGFGERRTVQFDGVSQNVSIQRRSKEEGWAIIFRRTTDNVETVAYRVPYSGNLPLPPSHGWVSAHPLAKGVLTLRHRGIGHLLEV